MYSTISRKTYKEYLAGIQKSLDTMEYQVPAASREIVASAEQLGAQQIAVMEAGIEQISGRLDSIQYEVTAGFELLSYSVDDLSSRVSMVNETLQWGFGRLIDSLSSLNSSMETLIQLASTPSHTWAIEQFTMARDAQRKHLYKESLDLLERAIDGYGSNSGYKLDHRFYMFRGIILLGEVPNADHDLIDLTKAEESFLAASRYAATDYPSDAAQCWLLAARAAYFNGRRSDSLAHLQKCWHTRDDLPESYYLAGKALIEEGETVPSINHVDKAIQLNRTYLTTLIGDESFAHCREIVDEYLVGLRKRWRDRAHAKLSETQSLIQACTEWRPEDYFKPHVEEAKAKWSKCRKEYKSNTVFGYQNAISQAQTLDVEIRDLREQTAGRRFVEIDNTVAEIEASRKRSQAFPLRQHQSDMETLERKLTKLSALPLDTMTPAEVDMRREAVKKVLREATDLERTLTASEIAVRRRNWLLMWSIGGAVFSPLAILPGLVLAGIVAVFTESMLPEHLRVLVNLSVLGSSTVGFSAAIGYFITRGHKRHLEELTLATQKSKDGEPPPLTRTENP